MIVLLCYRDAVHQKLVSSGIQHCGNDRQIKVGIAKHTEITVVHVSFIKIVMDILLNLFIIVRKFI